MAPLFKPKSKSDMDEMPSDQPKSLAMAVGIRSKKRKMAHGGHVDSPMSDEESCDMVERIMRKRKMAEGGMVDADKLQDSMGLDKMSDGGMVDLDHNGTESENMFDDLSEDALKENYEEDELNSVHEPLDSKGDDLSDADAHDRIDAIRRKVMSKRKG